MQNLIVNPAVRLFPPTEKRENWVALHLRQKNNYNLSLLHVHILMKAVTPITDSEPWTDVLDRYDLSQEDIKGVIENLLGLGLLINQSDPETKKALEIKEKWEKLGWAETYDYHLLTLDYPFVDYKTTKGLKADALRMKIYEQEKSDQERYKKYDSVMSSKPLTDIHERLNSLNTLFPLERTKRGRSTSLDSDTLETIATSVYGILRKRRPFGAQEAADLVRKTSPSGGARHPTELYIMVLDVKDMKPGLYHYNFGQNSLDFIKPLPNENFETNLEGLFRIQDKPEALFFMTSVFARNRYRYREPRTLRTVYMDVGHLSMTLKFVADSLGLECFFHHGINEKWFEGYINANEYDEGFMLGACLKGIA